MNDGRAALGNIRVIEGNCPGFGHRLRMMGAAAEHVRRGHNQGLLFPGSEKARVEVGQQRALASSGLHRLVPVGETLRPDPTHALHRAQIVFDRGDEEQTRSGAFRTGYERAKRFPRRRNLREVGRGHKRRLGRKHTHALLQLLPVLSPQILSFGIPAAGRLLDRTQPAVSVGRNFCIHDPSCAIAIVREGSPLRPVAAQREAF